jgi:hypothetical protein
LKMAGAGSVVSSRRAAGSSLSQNARRPRPSSNSRCKAEAEAGPGGLGAGAVGCLCPLGKAPPAAVAARLGVRAAAAAIRTGSTPGWHV